MELAYQWRRPAAIVLDRLVGLRIFCAPTEGYMESEPTRYYPLSQVSAEGEWKSLVG
jgi:hypothetical protein